MEKTAWQTMGYSWRDGNGVMTVRQSLRWVDPFVRACSPSHSLASIARTLRHVGCITE